MTQDEAAYVYYETIEGDAGLAEVTTGGVQELSSGTYGTTYTLEYDSFYDFMLGADDQMYTPEDLSVDGDGFYHPDGFIRFKVIQGVELGRDALHEL